MSQPLEGIRVLELGNFIAGPFCGMLLGDMGADVIKIERPARGDQTRAMPPLVNGESASFAALNRNKRSLVLDLKQDAGRNALFKLAETADVTLVLPAAPEACPLGLAPMTSTTMTLAFLTNGYAVKYVPTEYRPRIGRSKFHPIKDTAAYLSTVLRMVLYFRPLKVFLPSATLVILAGLLKRGAFLLCVRISAFDLMLVLFFRPELRFQCIRLD